jgi:hypothetical protein
MLKQIYIDKAINWISKKSTISIKAKLESYEPPKIFTNKETGEVVQADFSFVTQGGSKSYTEIALKSEMPRKLVTRWKLLSLMASLKSGKLYLLTPKGHKMFTKKLIDTYNINALIYDI